MSPTFFNEQPKILSVFFPATKQAITFNFATTVGHFYVTLTLETLYGWPILLVWVFFFTSRLPCWALHLDPTFVLDMDGVGLACCFRLRRPFCALCFPAFNKEAFTVHHLFIILFSSGSTILWAHVLNPAFIRSLPAALQSVGGRSINLCQSSGNSPQSRLLKIYSQLPRNL